MHPLSYEIKRAHWNAMWTAIRLYRAAGEAWKEETLAEMTPARCDLLQCVWDHDAEVHEFHRAEGLPPSARSIHLADLRTELGLAGVTVWKSVQRLVELEWVTLKPSKTAKRRHVVFLTALGIHALRMAQRCANTSFADELGRPKLCFYQLVDKFVSRDAAAQGVLSRKATSTSRPRTFRKVSDYYWWLIGHVRTIAQHFGSKAWRLYYPTAIGQRVRDEDDTCVDTERVPKEVKPRGVRTVVHDEAWFRALLEHPDIASEKFPS